MANFAATVILSVETVQSATTWNSQSFFGGVTQAVIVPNLIPSSGQIWPNPIYG